MKTALITGGAQRIGAQITQTLHEQGCNVIIHYHRSITVAQNLAKKLNNKRKNSASIVQAELRNMQDIERLCQSINRLDILINNAAVFYPTPMNKINTKVYQDIMNTNLMAPLFLSNALTKVLEKNQGCIVNIVDIHSERPLKNYPIYSISKAALAMMTKSLAKELAPKIRVCGVSPGLILWPENGVELSETQKNMMLKKIALQKQGYATDIADAVLFLVNSSYITGQVIRVDGGRTLNQ